MILALAVEQGIAFAGDPAPISGRAMATVFIVVVVLAAAVWYLRQRLQIGRASCRERV